MIFYFPYHLFKEKERIILYGFGEEGQAFYAQIKKYGYVELVAVADKNAARVGNVSIEPETGICRHEFDAILITVGDAQDAQRIKKRLISLGIKEQYIKWGGQSTTENGFWTFYFRQLKAVAKSLQIEPIERKSSIAHPAVPLSVDPVRFLSCRSDIKELGEVVDVIIPIYNAYEYVTECVESVLVSTDTPYNLYLANDCSTDSKIHEFLMKLKKRSLPHSLQKLTIIEHERNMGFLRTTNEAIQATKNHVVLLNSDTEVPKGWLRRLLQPILEGERVASVTPTTNAASFCSFPHLGLDNPLFENNSLNRIDNACASLSADCCMEVPSGVGFCIAMNRATIRMVGMFDTIFGLGYGEETQWCLRAAAAGWKNVWHPGLFVYHKHGVSFNQAMSQEKLKEKKRESSQIFLKQYPNYKTVMKKFREGRAWHNYYEWIKCQLWCSDVGIKLYVGTASDTVRDENYCLLRHSDDGKNIIWEIYHKDRGGSFSFQSKTLTMVRLKRLLELFRIKYILQMSNDSRTEYTFIDMDLLHKWINK